MPVFLAENNSYFSKLTPSRLKLYLPYLSITVSIRLCFYLSNTIRLQEGPRAPTNAGYCLCSGYPLELASKNLLLMTPHILITRCEEIKPVPTWKLPPCWLAFNVLHGDVQASREKSQPTGATVAYVLQG